VESVLNHAESEVLTTVILNSSVFCVIPLCCPLKVNDISFCLPLAFTLSFVDYTSILKTEGTCSSERLIDCWRNTRQNCPELSWTVLNQLYSSCMSMDWFPVHTDREPAEKVRAVWRHGFSSCRAGCRQTAPPFIDAIWNVLQVLVFKCTCSNFNIIIWIAEKLNFYARHSNQHLALAQTAS
jgi:hypothetical protein